MIKKYNFENSANKKLMAEILSKRERQPRAAFLSSLAAVMVAAISLTMVFGSLSTGALPLEEPEQQASVSSVSDGNTLPPEEVIRVHTETKTETVTVYNDTPQLSEALLVSDTVSAESPAEGKSLFNQKQQIFQWQYKGEVFTFFVKDNTVYRRNETTGKTVTVFEGEKEVSLFCLNDRYLFFGAENTVTIEYESSEYSNNTPYCYRVDLLTGEILRLFSYYSEDDIDCYPLKFIRFDGSDVVFSQQWERIKRYVVHKDGSYEVFYDDIVYPYTEVDYDDNIITDNIDDIIFDNNIDDKDNYNSNIDVMYDDFWLYLNDDNTLSGEYRNGMISDLGIHLNDLKRFGYDFSDFTDADGLIYRDNYGLTYIIVFFHTHQNDTDESLLLYSGTITGNGLEGGLIHVTIPDSSGMLLLMDKLSPKKVSVAYGYYDNGVQRIISELPITIDFDKLSAPTKSEPTYYPLENGENLTLTYYPINSLHAATPDSAD